METVGQNENHKTKKQRRRFPLGPSFFLKQNVRSVQKKLQRANLIGIQIKLTGITC